MVRVGRFNIKWTDIDMPELELAKLISHFAQSNKAEGKSTYFGCFEDQPMTLLFHK